MNSCLVKLELPEELKAVDVSTLFKNTGILSKKNEIPITELPLFLRYLRELSMSK